MTPAEMNAFVDSFESEHVRVHFDTGNIMLFQFPEHWIPILGKRIKNVHFKEFTKKGTDHSLESFRPLLDGTTNWPAVMEALDGDRLSRLPDVRVLPPVPALPRGADLPDVRLARSDAREEGPSEGVTAGSLAKLIRPDQRTSKSPACGCFRQSCCTPGCV